MSTASRDAGGLRPSLPVLAGLLLGALVFRPQLSAIGPLAGQIADGLGASHAYVGLLTAVPVLCMGLFAPAAPWIAGRLDAGAMLITVAAVIAVAGVLRGVVGGQAPMLAFTVVIGVATALSGPLQAMLVRERLASHVVAGTASYAAGTTAGAALAAAVAVPLAALLGGWQAGLVAVTVLSVAGLPVLALSLRRRAATDGGSATATTARRPALRDLPIRRPDVWGLGVLFGLQSCLYYGTGTWLPSAYVERGWDPGSAAFLVSVSSIAGFFAILLVPLASRRGIGRRNLLVAAAGACVVAMLGVAVLPAPGYVWAVMLGVGLSVMFALVQTLPSDAGRDAHETGGAAALMLLAGYLIAAAAPFALGAVRDATGSFEAGMWVLAGLGIAMMPFVWVLSPQRLQRSRPTR